MLYSWSIRSPSGETRHGTCYGDNMGVCFDQLKEATKGWTEAYGSGRGYFTPSQQFHVEIQTTQ